MSLISRRNAFWTSKTDKLLYSFILFGTSLGAQLVDAQPVRVNSLVATFTAGGANAAVTRGDLESILREDSSSDDKLMALGSVILGANLDALLMANNKFESVPQYRVTHVVNTLIEGNRLTQDENGLEIYQRLVDQWKAACEPRIAAGRGCDFAFRFEKQDWTIGVPDYSSRLSSKNLSHVTRDMVYATYRPTIHDLAKEALEKGRAGYGANGKTYFLTRDVNDTEATLIEKAKKLMMKVYLVRNYLVIDSDYISEQYKKEIQSLSDALASDLSRKEALVNVGSLSSSLSFDRTKTNSIQIREGLISEFRKLHSKLYFGTEEVVIFRRREVNRAIFQNDWDGFAFRLARAPETYQEFMKAVTDQLDTLYLKVTRQKMLSPLLGQSARRSNFFVSPRDVEQHVAQMPAFKRRGHFSLLSIPLNAGQNDEDLKKISTQIVDAFSARNGKSADSVFEVLVRDVKATYQIDLLKESADFEGRLAKVLPAPSSSRDLQMYQILFAQKQSEEMGIPAPDMPELIYYVDRERQMVSFVHADQLSIVEPVQLDAYKEKEIDTQKVEEQILSLRYSELYKKSVLKVLEDSLVRVRDPEFVFGESRDAYSYSASNEIRDVVLKSVEKLEASMSGSGWARFIEAALRSPLKPSSLSTPQAPKEKSRRPKIFGG